MQFVYRPSEERGGGNHGWLRTFHTFSFADYYDPSFQHFGALRVVNEDRVAAATGFPTHPHREAEIFSYIISGELSHKDSMGNVETMVRGDVQMTSGGTGIKHSEYNDNKEKEVHFLQIWATPNKRGLAPRYFTRHFTDAEKLDKLVQIVGPVGSDGVVEEREGKGPTPIHAPLHTFVTLLSAGKSVSHTILPSLNGQPRKKVYIQSTQVSGYNPEPAPTSGLGPRIKVTGVNGQETVLGEGDGVFILQGQVGDELTLTNEGRATGEVVLFEMDDE